MNKYILFVAVIFSLFSCDFFEGFNGSEDKKSATDGSSEKKVLVNQVGYLSKGQKYFIVNKESLSFEVKNSTDNSIAFSGDIALWQENDSSSGETLFIGYFDSLETEGSYFIELDDGTKSYNFKISDTVFNDVRDKSLKSFYFQRASVDLKSGYAGEFTRKSGHTEPLQYHKSSKAFGETAKDVSGGWYDAGDYGRYITPASTSLGVMLIGYEQFPEKFDFDNLNIPESNNNVSDFLDEMRYELEWMLKMQYKGEGAFKGALPYMLNSKDYVSGMPADLGDEDKQYIYDFSSVATANFTATLALASRIFKAVDSDFSVKCLDASLLAWDYLSRNSDPYPENGFKRPDDTLTGGYADSRLYNKDDSEDRLWAAIELFRTTNESQYLNYFNTNKTKLNDSWNTIWTDLTGYAKLQYIFADGVEESIRAEFKTSFISYCDSLVNISNNDGFKTVLENFDYRWGNNGEVLLNRAQLLILGYELTDKKEYYNSALSQLNYVLGLNVNNISYVTNTGSKSPKYIHHAMFFANDFDYVFPGLLAGGPNSSIHGDETLPLYFNESTPPAKCYVDHKDSWASNENCILYNAPLVPVAAYFTN